jgi:hypothetical protein
MLRYANLANLAKFWRRLTLESTGLSLQIKAHKFDQALKASEKLSALKGHGFSRATNG